MGRKDPVWYMTLHRLAQGDLLDIDKEDPRLANQIVNCLEYAKKFGDILNPRDKRYNAILSYPAALGCIRLKRYGCEWRCILRVIRKSDKAVVDARFVTPDPALHYLQVVYIGIKDRAHDIYVLDIPDRISLL